MSSGHNTAFLKDPVDYLSKVVVLTINAEFEGIDANAASAQIYLDLVLVDSGLKSGQKVVQANFSNTPKGDSPIEGCYVPYASEGDVKNGRFPLPAVALPVGGLPKFIFTGAMNGCSLLLAKKADNFYAIHYPNSGGASSKYPLLTKAGYTYVKSIDYFNILGTRGYSGVNVGTDRDQASKDAGNIAGWFNTFSFFYYKDNWKIVAQPQFAWATGGNKFTARLNGDVIVV